VDFWKGIIALNSKSSDLSVTPPRLRAPQLDFCNRHCKKQLSQHLISLPSRLGVTAVAMTKKSTHPQPSVNRRTEARISAKGEIRYLPTRAAKDWRFLTGRLLDCSPHGIGIECAHAMDVDDDFIVKVHVGKLRLAVYRVQNVRPWDAGYRIGGEFIGLLIDPGDVDHDAIVEALAGVRVESDTSPSNPRELK